MADMRLKYFHPIVETWFHKTFKNPSEIQVKAWPEIKKHRSTLIAAPTGSGKTLAAFLAAIDDLIRQGLKEDLAEKTQLVYVSPLKALSNDIEKNLRHPLAGIREELKNEGLPDVKLKAAVRTGDTTASQRTAMIKHPPHILVTTPESLYLLLTSDSGRKILSDVHTVILDEIHALTGDKRGSHLSLSLERLEALTRRQLVRIGLSATQKPIEKVANFLVGNRNTASGKIPCTILDTGHTRKLDLSIEVPGAPLTAVMANEVWGEIYERLKALIQTHQTTLIFVNTRRLAERMAYNLAEQLGSEMVSAHHGSMSKEQRLDAEQRLKSGTLRVLIATASLELGIDIGAVDLVCQIGSPKSIAAFLQRVGRSGHTLEGTPKGRLFPLSLDELVECAAILDAIRRGELDRIIMPEKPLDILAQQIVAELSCREYLEDDLWEMITKSYPYRDLTRVEFDDIIKMLSEGFTTRRGRRSAYLHYDMVNKRLRGRKNARLTSLLCGGAIPDNFDYEVILEPTNTFIGTLNEDFAIESIAGDIFQLGNNSWRILRVENGKVRVENAAGLPPTIPFWLGEAPGRSAELSYSVSRLREEVSTRLGDLKILKGTEEAIKRLSLPQRIGNLSDDSHQPFNNEHSKEPGHEPDSESWKTEAIDWLINEAGIVPPAAEQIVHYLGCTKAAFNAMPTQQTLVLERFFDEGGDQHLVLHSPFGSRLNRAWGLALRKRFCKKFNFELQAAANEDTIILSLGATHSFPLEEIFSYLNANSVRNILVQALLDSPMFEIRWRWNASRALAVLRRNAGKKVPAQLQRMQSEDLIALLFPDQLACLENIAGEREVPDHPLVSQTIHDCLYEAMDIEALEQILRDLKKGKINWVAKDLKEASPMAQEILNAKPYAFLDDAPLEERRTNAVMNRRWLSPAEAADLANLDQNAIDAVKAEAWPQAENADELHDALVLYGFLEENEGKAEKEWEDHFNELVFDQRATVLILPENGKKLWIAVERVLQLKQVFPAALWLPDVKIPEQLYRQTWTTESALLEIIRGRMEMLGPVKARDLAVSLSLPVSKIEQVLMALENEGFVFRGNFTPGQNEQEWCERRLLARIHRYTLQRLRKEIEPVSSAEFMRFLFSWHRMNPSEKPEGPGALQEVLKQLEGYEAPAASWESDILPARVKDYDYLWLDIMCISGKTVWARFRQNGLNGNKSANPIKTTPISLVYRINLALWQNLSANEKAESFSSTSNAGKVRHLLNEQGASFFDEIVEKTKLFKVQVEEALSELVALGLVTSDSYTGLRALLVPSKYRTSQGSRRNKKIAFEMNEAGRWSLLPDADATEPEAAMAQAIARILLRRYGVIFRKIADLEHFCPPWRELVRVLRTMEARGEIRGGRFIDGVWGEQFALPEAINKLRSIRKEEETGKLVAISAADPLNLTGILTPGKRVAAFYNNRLLYEDGIPVAVREGKEITFLTKMDKAEEWKIKNALVQREISPKLRAYLGKGIL